MKYSIGIDIGGTKIAACLVASDGSFTNEINRPTNTNSREELFKQVVSIIEEILAESGEKISDLEGIGLGVPGKVDVTNGVAVFQNNIPWENFPVKKRLGEVYPGVRVKIDNDVKVATLAEYKAKDMAPDSTFVYLTISTGIACSMISNGRFIRGNGFSGEVGFLPVGEGEELLEPIAAGPGIEKYGQDLYQDNTLTTKDIFERYNKGEEKATKAVERSIKAIVKTLYAVITILDPHCLVIGGSVATNNPKYFEAVVSGLGKYLVDEQRHILDNIHLSNLSSDNGMVGAGMLVM